MDLKAYQRDCLLGTLSGLLTLAGDLCLSIVPYTAGDSGFFAREAYRALCAAVERLMAPSDAVLECACGTGLLTVVILHLPYPAASFDICG